MAFYYIQSLISDNKLSMNFCQLNKGDIVVYSNLRPNKMGLKKFSVKSVKNCNYCYCYCQIKFNETDLVISVPLHSDYYTSKAHKFIAFVECADKGSNYIKNLFQDLIFRLDTLLNLTNSKKSRFLREVNSRADNIIALEKQLENKPLLVVDKLCPGVEYYIGHFGSTEIKKAKVVAVKISAGWIQLSNYIFLSIPKNVEQDVWFQFHNRYVSTNKNALIEFLIEKEKKKKSVAERKYNASIYREIKLLEIRSEICDEYEEEFKS